MPLIDQFFMFLVKIRLELFQQDLGCRFNVSQPTISRIIITWANFMYFQLGSIPILPSRDKVDRYMPECFKAVYPSTRVIHGHPRQNDTTNRDMLYVCTKLVLKHYYCISTDETKNLSQMQHIDIVKL